VVAKYGNLYNILDTAKVADSILLLLSADDEIDSFSEGCISCLLGQGMPAVTIVAQVWTGTFVSPWSNVYESSLKIHEQMWSLQENSLKSKF